MKRFLFVLFVCFASVAYGGTPNPVKRDIFGGENTAPPNTQPSNARPSNSQPKNNGNNGNNVGRVNVAAPTDSTLKACDLYFNSASFNQVLVFVDDKYIRDITDVNMVVKVGVDAPMNCEISITKYVLGKSKTDVVKWAVKSVNIVDDTAFGNLVSKILEEK